MVSFVKALRSEQAAFLDTNPLVNHMLNVIARRARRTPDPLNGLQIGECFVGHKGLGLSEQQYRTVKKNLQKWGLVEFKKAGRASDQGTIAILLNSNVYDINSGNEEAADPNGSQCQTGSDTAANLTGVITEGVTEDMGRESSAETDGYSNSERPPNGRPTEGSTEEQRKANGRATEGQRQTKNDKNGRMEECKKTELPAAAAKPSDDVYEIFTYWRDVMKKNKSAKCTDDRAKAVKKRLAEGYSIDELKAAIFGCSVTPHNIGQNEQGKRFDCLELICRNGGNVERFIANGKTMSPTEQRDAEVDDWINGIEQMPLDAYSGGETIDHEPF